MAIFKMRAHILKYFKNTWSSLKFAQKSASFERKPQVCHGAIGLFCRVRGKFPCTWHGQK